MNPKGLKHILKRVQFWPAAAQQEALQSLRAIEEDFTGADFLSGLGQGATEGVSLDQLKDELDL
jgi:hypothetical protein